ncbi:MAG: hypothetical protein K0S76_1896 [Herbinix sp.]|jgi:uncharacterized membrane protein|nr:hypothetical protein [Herbinix sp.]
MNKKTFMRKLAIALHWNYNSSDIEDILNDYHEFFLAGITEGKTENELCTEFGKPKEIANNIRKESIRKKAGNISITTLLRLILAIIIFAFLLLTFYYTNANTNMILDSIISSIIIVFPLWFVLGGEIFKVYCYFYQSSNNKKKIVLLHILLVLCACMTYLFIAFSIKDWNSIYVQTLEFNLYEIGPFVTGIFFFLIGIGLLIFLYSLYGFYNYSLQYYTVICHCIGYISFFLCLINSQHQLDDVSRINDILSKTIFPYGAGLLMAILFAIYIHQIERRRKITWMLK